MQKLKASVGVGLVIGVFLAIVIALTLLPTIADLSIGASGTGNMTGITATIMDLVPVFFIIGIVILTLAGLKVGGKI